MMTRRARVQRMLAAAGVLLLSTLQVAAQDADSASTDTAAEGDAAARWATERRAVRLGHDGIALYEASRWNEAHDRFQAAEQLVHSPVFVLYMARCRRNAGRLLEAAERLERLSLERVPEDAPPAWHGATADAGAELIALRRAIPRIVVVVRGAQDARVSLDGRELPASSLGKWLDLDPGRHSIIARDSKGRQIVRRFHVAEGQATTTLNVSFHTAFEARRDPKASASDTASVWRTAGFVLLGVGAAGLGVGIGAAVVAAGRDTSEDREDWGAWSTAGLAAGGVVAGAGVLLLLLHPSRANSGSATGCSGCQKNILFTGMAVAH